MVHSPLDQFKIAPLISFVVAGVDLSFTNFFLASLLALFTLQSYVFFIKDVKTDSFFVIPSGWQNLIEKLYALVVGLLSEIITTGSEKYLPFLTAVFMFILSNNLLGLVPYSFTTTSYATLTFFMSFSIFIGMTILGRRLAGGRRAARTRRPAARDHEAGHACGRGGRRQAAAQALDEAAGTGEASQQAGLGRRLLAGAGRARQRRRRSAVRQPLTSAGGVGRRRRARRRLVLWPLTGRLRTAGRRPGQSGPAPHGTERSQHHTGPTQRHLSEQCSLQHGWSAI